jgi:hypothetical protein
MKTRVIHVSDQPYDVYIGRPGPWGNPYQIGKDGTRTEVLAKYREYILANKALLTRLPELRGKTLGCWCKPLRCHGDVLVELLEAQDIERMQRLLEL